MIDLITVVNGVLVTVCVYLALRTLYCIGAAYSIHKNNRRSRGEAWKR